jgi:uncharacterized protein YbbK (DUF523 family)
MQKILISACLLGQPVRYDGKHKQQLHQRLQTWQKAGRLIAVCPEVAGELPTPRDPAEIAPGQRIVMTNHGEDVTEAFLAGSQRALELAQKNKVRVAILKARSPSCGSTEIYDGNFCGKAIPGMGITAELLTLHGIRVFNEESIDKALDLASSGWNNQTK